MIRKGRRELVGIGYIFEFPIPDPRSKRLLLFVPNFSTANDENGAIDQSYVLLVKYITMVLQNINFKEN